MTSKHKVRSSLNFCQGVAKDTDTRTKIKYEQVPNTHNRLYLLASDSLCGNNFLKIF